jgi:hypothetical protein
MPMAVIGVVVIGIALIAGAPRSDGIPLDPSSTGPLGTRGLVLLLQHEGETVRVSDAVPDDGVAVALVLEDNLSSDQRDGLEAWVNRGGTLVVTDPQSPLAGAAAFQASEKGALTPGCALPSLSEVRTLDVPGAALYEVPGPDTACFAESDATTGRRAAFLVARAQGRGTVVALGGPNAFVNTRLDKGDNSVLAVGLLAPVRGRTVAVLRPPRAGEGRKTLVDLISPHLKAGFLELLAAFVVVCLWRARRLGRPVLEQQLVELPGSELVVAVGNLLHQAGRRDDAGRLIRDELRRTIAERLSLGRDAPPEVVADVAAARTGVDRNRILDALADRPPVDEAALVTLAQSAEAIHQEVTRAR